MKLYFAYGANLNRDSMRQRCPGAQPITQFHLRDHRLVFAGAATILPDPQSRVPGALWYLTPECEESLDHFENWPYFYRKETIIQDDREFFVYVMNQFARLRPPSQGYFEIVQQGYRDWNLDHRELESARQQSLWESDLGFLF